VDDENLIIGPARPELTNPFLLLGESWFSSPGFNWHPDRGLETVTLVLHGVLEQNQTRRLEGHACAS
jgi:hypothetical protein